MAIKSNNPAITALRLKVETLLERQLTVHSDFQVLTDRIEDTTRQRISESTLERVWNYSTRGYATVSLRTLDVLAEFCGYNGWREFNEELRLNSPSESEFFDVEVIRTDNLQPGDRLRFGWLPDRECTVRYLGSYQFVAEECHNSKIQRGDTFSCLVFQLGKSLEMEYFADSNGQGEHKRYTVGMRNGLTSLSVI